MPPRTRQTCAAIHERQGASWCVVCWAALFRGATSAGGIARKRALLALEGIATS